MCDVALLRLRVLSHASVVSSRQGEGLLPRTCRIMQQAPQQHDCVLNSALAPNGGGQEQKHIIASDMEQLQSSMRHLDSKMGADDCTSTAAWCAASVQAENTDASGSRGQPGGVCLQWNMSIAPCLLPAVGLATSVNSAENLSSLLLVCMACLVSSCTHAHLHQAARRPNTAISSTRGTCTS